MRLQAVEIRQIDDEGRVGSDGRLRIGDRIVEINQRPVYQVNNQKCHSTGSTNSHLFTNIRQMIFITKSGILRRNHRTYSTAHSLEIQMAKIPSVNI